jgi:hypothetical protein
MRGDRKCRPAVRRAGQRPHMRFDLSFQTMMSSQVHPQTPDPQERREPDKPFNSRCHRSRRQAVTALAGETDVFRDRIRFKIGGARRDRTDDLMLAKHALYQLSYGP